jgi:hypothetical protein
MKCCVLTGIALSLALGAAAWAQDVNSASPAGQNPAPGAYGQRGGRGGIGMGPGRGLTGTVTEVASDHYTVKTDTGETYAVHFSANTRILKQTAGMGQGMGRGMGGGMGRGAGGNRPESLKPTDIKVGDAIAAMGEVDATAKSVDAMMILKIDPERAKQMREMQASYGKTWLQGKVTAIEGVKVTLLGTIDNATHAFVADENTTFRKSREPITLADVQIGDMVRAEGVLKDGIFTAATVNVMGMPGTPMVPRNGGPQ